jgi:hypothetical protein
MCSPIVLQSVADDAASARRQARTGCAVDGTPPCSARVSAAGRGDAGSIASAFVAGGASAIGLRTGYSESAKTSRRPESGPLTIRRHERAQARSCLLRMSTPNNQDLGLILQTDDHVDVTVIGRPVGPGRVVDASGDLGNILGHVIGRRPDGIDYEFGASRTFFESAGPGRWRIDMPAPTLRQFRPDC